MAAGDVEANVTTNNGRAGASFDGVDDYVSIAHNPNQINPSISNGFTISAWVNPKSIGEAAGRIFVKTDAGTSPSNGFHLLMGNQNLSFEIDGSVGVSSTPSSVLFSEWTHVIVTVNSLGQVSYFINNTANNSALRNAPSKVTNTQDILIGNRNGGTDRTFDGIISKVKMWNRVLTTDEIAKDYAGLEVEGKIIDIPLQTNYTDNEGNATTNSGSILTIQDDAIAAQLKADRVTANDTFLMTGMPGGQVTTAVIEEAP